MRTRTRRSNSRSRLKKAQLSFYCEPEDYEKLKALSERTGVPQQVYLRRGLDHVLHVCSTTAMRASVADARRRSRLIKSRYEDVETGWRKVMRSSDRAIERSVGRVWPMSRRGKLTSK